MTPAARASDWLREVASPQPLGSSSEPAAKGLPEIRVNGRELRDVSAETLEAVGAARRRNCLLVLVPSFASTGKKVGVRRLCRSPTCTFAGR